MRVLLVCPYAWDSPGGVQVHVRELGERLRSRGHEVLALGPGTAAPPEPWILAVGRPMPLRYNQSVAPICFSRASTRRVREAMGRFRADVVHAHEPLVPSSSLVALLASDAPVVATFHSGATRSLLFDLAAPVLRRVAQRIAVRVAVSETAERFASARIGGDFRIVPNGVPVERFEAAEPADLPGGRRLLFVGRLDRRKGFPVAVRAFERLAQELADLWLVVAGDGPERDAIGALPGEIRARVHMAGRVDNRHLPPLHAAADVFLAPSLGGESFGVVLVEAMAAGVPVVASRTPGYDEVVRDGIDGLLVAPGDPSAAARAIRRILRDPDLATRLASAGRDRAQAFSWEAVTDRLEAIYRDVVRPHAGGRC
ncbi:MAG: glycosyltransferase family 4 protein [Actinomycetota bacterium]